MIVAIGLAILAAMAIGVIADSLGSRPRPARAIRRLAEPRQDGSPTVTSYSEPDLGAAQ